MALFKKKLRKNKNDENRENKNNLDISTTDSKSIFEKNRRTLKDLMATEYDFTDPKKVIIGDNLYAKNMYIAFLPNEVDFVSSFHSLYNFGDIDTSIFINPMDIEVAKAELSKLRTNLATEVLEAGGNLNRADDMQDKEAEAVRLRDEIKNGLNKLYDVSIMSTIYETNERELNNNADRLRETLGQTDLGIRNGALFQEKIFFSNKPLADNTFNLYHTFDKRSLAAVFPFTSNNIAHENGVMLGLNIDNARPVFFDNFDSTMNNYNVFVFGPSGYGKSTLIKSFAARSGTLDSVQNIALDIEPEYGIVAEQMGGVNIVLEPRGRTTINLFDITISKEKDEITGKIIEYIDLDAKINSVTDQLMVMARGFVGNNKHYDDVTRTIIKRCVYKAYEPMSLTSEPDSLYEYIDTGLTHNRVKKTPPTLSDWYSLLKEESKLDNTATHVPYYDDLIKIMSNFIRTEKGGLACFDGQTTSDVKLGYDIPFINFDLSRLNEKTELPLAQYIIADFIWEQMIKRNVARPGEKPHKIRLIIDEAWRLVKFEEALNFLITAERRGRKKNTSTWVLTQQFDEFYNEETSVIIKQSFTKFFLRPDNTEVDNIKDVFKLTDGEISFLRTSERGEVLMKAGTVSAKVKVLIPDFEMDFIQTNQNQQTEETA